MSKLKNIFLIDDDETFVFLTGRIIKATHKVDSVKTFGNGKDAIEYLSENSSKSDTLPEIIFFDLNMPILDGWGFIEEFIALEPILKKKIKLFIITSSIAVHDIEKAKSYNIISDYMIKPVLKEKFIDIIDNFTEG